MAWVYQCSSAGEAHVRAALVERGFADLCVYLVSSVGLAKGDDQWFVDQSKESARTWVYFTSVGMSQVKICFVKDRAMAGWQREHPLQGKFR